MKRQFSVTGAVALACASVMQSAGAADVGTANGAAASTATPTPAAARAGADRKLIQKAPGGDGVTLNFVNAEIEGVVKVISEITGRNFLVDPRVKGTISIVSAKPLSRAMVYEVFLSSLRLQGFSVVEDRGIAKIVPETDAKLYPSPTYGPGDDKPRGGGDRMQTQIFNLKYESATQLVPILRPLIPGNNTISAYQGSNSLVITDYASNLQRIEKIINSIDQPSGKDPIVIPLRYASAVDVALTVSRLFVETAPAQGAAAVDATQRITVVADARSNSLLVRADNSARLARLSNLVASLDVPTSAAGNIHIVYLKNAEAVKLAETLRTVYLGENTSTAPRAAASSVTPLGASVASPSALGQPAFAAPFSTSAQAQPGGARPGIIQADAATNSIIIVAPDAVYNDLRAALEKLDARRAQVYVEALVAEVTAAKAAEFGIQWQDFSGVNSTRTNVVGGTSFGAAGQNITGVAQNVASAGAGLSVGVIRGTVTLPGVGQILNLGMLVRALETDNNANILSTPTVLTLDNEEAKIVIGQNVPFVTGQYAVTGAATTPTPFQTIERRDVGLSLRIKPQISEGGTVRLQIFQEVSSIQDNTNAAGIITNKRAVESTVLVDDGQIIVIGGLIQDSVSDVVQKVPVLGDIPLLGSLFQYKSRSRTKTNLMVFLRPTVLRDALRANPLTSERYDYIMGEQRRATPAHDVVLPDIPSPRLPPLPAGDAQAR